MGRVISMSMQVQVAFRTGIMATGAAAAALLSFALTTRRSVRRCKSNAGCCGDSEMKTKGRMMAAWYTRLGKLFSIDSISLIAASLVNFLVSACVCDAA